MPMRAVRRAHIGTVLMAHNRAGRELSHVVTLHHGRLLVREDGVHFNAEGQIKLGKVTASAVEDYYQTQN